MTLLTAAHYLHLAASLLVFGAGLFPLYAGAPAPRRLLRCAAWGALGFGVIAIALRVHGLGASVLDLAATWIGRVWLAQLVLAAALVVLAWRGSRVVVAIAALNVAAFALIGHANAIAGLRGAAVQAVHLLAAGAWAGGLAALLLALRAAPSLALAQRFSRVGLVCVVTLAATGAYALYVNTGLPLPMLYYAYGRLADLKIKLFAGALALAGFNRFYAAPRGAWRLLVASVTFELALLALVIAVAANLGNTEPYG